SHSAIDSAFFHSASLPFPPSVLSLCHLWFLPFCSLQKGEVSSHDRSFTTHPHTFALKSPMIDGGSKAERDEQVRQRLADTSPEGAPPPARWRRASWALLLVVFLILAALAAAAGWAIAGRTGAI